MARRLSRSIAAAAWYEYGWSPDGAFIVYTAPGELPSIFQRAQ